MPEKICNITKSGFCLRTGPALGKGSLLGKCGEPNISPRCLVCPWIKPRFAAHKNVEITSQNPTTAIVNIDDAPAHAIISGILVDY